MFFAIVWMKNESYVTKLKKVLKKLFWEDSTNQISKFSGAGCHWTSQLPPQAARIKNHRLFSPKFRQHQYCTSKLCIQFFTTKKQFGTGFQPWKINAKRSWFLFSKCRWRKLCKPSFSVTSAAVMALGKSSGFYRVGMAWPKKRGWK